MGKKGASYARKATSIFRGKKKERSQPLKRQKLGLLEKHKDYVQRARNWHAKEDRIKAMQNKAEMRNPDEFYFKMQSGKTKGGVASAKNLSKGLNMETVKVLKTQDLGYVTMKRMAEATKVTKLGANLQFVGLQKPREHTIFVDSEADVDSFDPAKHFNTAPELVGRHFNRPTLEQLRDTEMYHPSKKELNQTEKEKAKAYNELLERRGREEKLTGWMTDMGMRTQLMGKGKKRKVKNGKNGAMPIYKWSTVRKK